jgi:hypothetical protein
MNCSIGIPADEEREEKRRGYRLIIVSSTAIRPEMILLTGGKSLFRLTPVVFSLQQKINFVIFHYKKFPLRS